VQVQELLAQADLPMLQKILSPLGQQRSLPVLVEIRR
jgi:hypothetical protein